MNDKRKNKKDKTILTEELKSGLEHLSGFSMERIKVHYNSVQPEQLNDVAFEQVTNIHLVPGQEKHLPHEAWHIVQQNQGRVKSAKQIVEGKASDESKKLENEADTMGNKINGK